MGFLDASHLRCSNNRASTAIVKVFTQLISVDVRLPESRIIATTVRTDTIDARSAWSTCVHTAIVNNSALMDGGNLIGFTVCVCVSNVVYFSLVALHPFDLHSCSRPLREFIFSKLPRHRHAFTFTSAPLNHVREKISHSLATHTEPFTSNTNS